MNSNGPDDGDMEQQAQEDALFPSLITPEPYNDGEPSDDPVWMDADALASAGWGTDEDYGCFGGDGE